MLSTGIGLLLGALLLHWTGLPPPVVAGSLPLLAWAAWRWPRLRFLAWLMCGWLWAGLHAAWTLQPELPVAAEGRNLQAIGRVQDLPRVAQGHTRFLFQVEQLRLDGRALDFDGQVRLSWYGRDRPALRSGERWRLTVRLKRPHGLLNPGGFDYEAWLFARGIRATGYVRPGNGAVRLQAADWRGWHHRLRQGFAERLARLDQRLDHRGVLRALVIGDRGEIPEQRWAQLRATGTSHLLAISGLHIGFAALLGGLVGGALWRACQPLQRRWARRRWALGCAWVTALAYAALAGFSLPTQRALIMLSVAVVALLAGRNLHPAQGLGAALTAVLLWSPGAPLEAGFWLSFAAVAVILYLLAGRVGRAPGWSRWLGLQPAVALGLAPLTLFYFQQAPLLGPLANLLAIPWVGLAVVPLCLAGALALAVFGHDLLLLVLADRLLEVLWWWLEWLLRLPGVEWRGGSPTPLSLAFAALGLLWLLAPRALPARWLGLALLLPALAGGAPAPAAGEFRVLVMDVGQGLAVLVRTRRHALLFDAGPASPGGFNAARAAIVPSLLELGVRRLDRVVISHADGDHAGGLSELRAAVPVARLMTSQPLSLDQPDAEPCVAGQGWEWDGVRFSVLHPAARAAARDNDRSCVLRVDGPGGSALLPGDIEAGAEAALLRSGAALRAELLIAPHHGSGSSSTGPWVRAVAPEQVVFSTGYRNRFGFPANEVVARYRHAGARVADTAELGAIEYRATPRCGLLGPYAARAEPRYWRRPPPADGVSQPALGGLPARAQIKYTAPCF